MTDREPVDLLTVRVDDRHGVIGAGPVHPGSGSRGFGGIGDTHRCGGVALIGDAAHATAPVWAQGAALAIEDALVLADLLAARSDWAGVGAEFERLRRPRVAHVQAATDRMSRIAGLPGRLRDIVAPIVGPTAYRAAYGPLRAPVISAGC
ncbi:MAG: FAD-dependent oxidoreductase [Pseudonocardiaceae bacterium]